MSDDEGFVYLEPIQEHAIMLSDYDIDNQIHYETAMEKNQLYEEISHVTDLFEYFAEILHSQGTNVSQAHTNVENSDNHVETARDNLAISEKYKDNKFLLARDAAIIIGGCVLGMGGFLLGPFVGIGTVAAGASAGSAAVYGIRKHHDNKTKKIKDDGSEN